VQAIMNHPGREFADLPPLREEAVVAAGFGSPPGLVAGECPVDQPCGEWRESRRLAPRSSPDRLLTMVAEAPAPGVPVSPSLSARGRDVRIGHDLRHDVTGVVQSLSDGAARTGLA